MKEIRIELVDDKFFIYIDDKLSFKAGDKQSLLNFISSALEDKEMSELDKKLDEILES